jgi:hypothetical protein
MVRARRLLALLTAVACIGILAAGCGGSSDSDDGSSAMTSPDSQPSEPSEVPSQKESNGDGEQKSGEGGESTHLSPEERRDDTALVEQVVRDLIDAMNTQDESVCERLFDRHLVAPSERDEEEARCRESIANHAGGVVLVRIESLRIRQSRFGREALVDFVVVQDKRPSRLAFHLMKVDGRYLIDRGVPAG